jgi:chitinase
LRATSFSYGAAAGTGTGPRAEAPAWAPGVYYPAGHPVSYEGALYTVLLSHCSQVGWEPTQAPTLWRKAS